MAVPKDAYQAIIQAQRLSILPATYAMRDPLPLEHSPEGNERSQHQARSGPASHSCSNNEIGEIEACRPAMIDPIGDHAQGEMMPVLRARAHPASRVRSILP